MVRLGLNAQVSRPVLLLFVDRWVSLSLFLSESSGYAMDAEQRKTVTDLMQKGLVPDDELRQICRNQCAKRLRSGYKPTHEQQQAELLKLVKSLRQMNVACDVDSLNEFTYDMPMSLMQSVFGSTLKDSCCYFKDESMTLDEAEIAMMELYCERAQLKDGQRVLDLGCGWGAVTLYIAQKYKNCHVTALTNSVTQKEFVEQRSKELNLSNVKAILADISTYETKDTFDRVIIAEVLEHMKNYELLLRSISKWLTKDGLFFVQHICHKTFANNGEIHGDDWHLECKFPPGTLLVPSANLLLYFQDDLSVVNHWTLSGKNYQRTSTQWLKRLDANANKVLETFSGSKEEARKSINYWRFYSIMNSETFGYNNGEEWMSCHVLFKKK